MSLDALRRHAPHLSLQEFFRRHFGRRGLLREARSNFVESCAAYSVVCYLLQVCRDAVFAFVWTFYRSTIESLNGSQGTWSVIPVLAPLVSGQFPY